MLIVFQIFHLLWGIEASSPSFGPKGRGEKSIKELMKDGGQLQNFCNYDFANYLSTFN